jgi:hypothetical protein
MHAEMHVGLLSTPYCHPILKEVEMCRQTLAELLSMKLHQILYSVSVVTYVRTERHTAINRATFETFHCKHSQHESSPLERIPSQLQLPSIHIRLNMAIQVYKFGIDIACAKDPLFSNRNGIKGYVAGLILPEERIPRLSE